MPKKLFLDTCTIIALDDLKNEDFDILRDRLEESNSELHASHIQGDEKYRKRPSDPMQIYTEAFAIFEAHGIKIHWENPTKGGVFGVSRFGHSSFFGEPFTTIYKELVCEVRKCDEERGRHQDKTVDEEKRERYEEKKSLNVARDALIAITSLDHDYFITSDYCLHKSLRKVLQNSENRTIFEKIPEIIYEQPCAEKILTRILAVLDSAHKAEQSQYMQDCICPTWYITQFEKPSISMDFGKYPRLLD
jgi:hypothetical protein